MTTAKKAHAVERVAPISGVPVDTPEGMGFGMWIDEVDQIDSVIYVNSVRDAESRTLSEYAAELCKDQTIWLMLDTVNKLSMSSV